MNERAASGCFVPPRRDRGMGAQASAPIGPYLRGVREIKVVIEASVLGQLRTCNADGERQITFGGVAQKAAVWTQHDWKFGIVDLEPLDQ